MHPNHSLVTVIQADRIREAEKARAARMQRVDSPAQPHKATPQRGIRALFARVAYAR